VVRGNEYLSSAPKYNLLYEAFGWEVPTYVHCPLITDEKHHKLSKRSGHSSFEDLIEQGFVTEAVINYVALLGWSPSEDREIYSLEELVAQFDYHHMSKSPAVFDIQKLRWMNGEYIKSMDFDQFAERAIPQIRKTVTKNLDLDKIARMVKTRIEVFPDIDEMVDFFEKLPEYGLSLYQNKKWKVTPEKSLTVLMSILPMLEAQEAWDNDALYEVLKTYSEREGVKAGFTIWPVRIALSGKAVTPAGATEIMEVLGKEESLARIREGIRKLTDAQ
jgi:glutamyl-tRNA synthetase